MLLLFYAGHKRSTAGGGFDPALEWLVDPGFDSAPTWDVLGGGDVNGSIASHLHVNDGSSPITYGATTGLIAIPPDGTYRLAWPALDNVVTAPDGVAQIGIGKVSILSFNAPAISAAAWAAGGTQDFVVAGAVSRRFMMKFSSSGVLNFGLSGASLKRVA